MTEEGRQSRGAVPSSGQSHAASKEVTWGTGLGHQTKDSEVTPQHLPAGVPGDIKPFSLSATKAIGEEETYELGSQPHQSELGSFKRGSW